LTLFRQQSNVLRPRKQEAAVPDMDGGIPAAFSLYLLLPETCFFSFLLRVMKRKKSVRKKRLFGTFCQTIITGQPYF
jgi:hypothetical protein